MSAKGCELCSNPARMFCESDQASLCWDCDEKVHAANFLVAKHSRTLLCHVCHRLTPWKAAGLKIGHTVSVCHSCAHDAENQGPSSGGGAARRQDDDGGGGDSQESESDGGEYYSDTEDDFSEAEEEEDGENQVVPMSASRCDSPPPAAAAASSSTSEENVSYSSSKRSRDENYESEDEDGCCSSQNLDSKLLNASGSSLRESDENYTSSSLRPLKMRRRSDGSPMNPAAADTAASLGTSAIVEKLKRFQQQIATGEGNTSATILGLCKLARD
ncbi:hypothetical protein ABFS83_13G175000 [Erythranthe nasuta]